MNYQVVRIGCAECGRVTVVRVWEGGDDNDLLVAGPGDFVERGCRACEKETDHLVMAEAAAAA